ncbi:MAG TPA: trypsin-like peptidase domain-containing protein [Micromonosporaceae bacterium]|nr:trypsin-like peptidase domain-containing protein [Micromonosporaceae bacterium]
MTTEYDPNERPGAGVPNPAVPAPGQPPAHAYPYPTSTPQPQVSPVSAAPVAAQRPLAGPVPPTLAGPPMASSPPAGVPPYLPSGAAPVRRRPAWPGPAAFGLALVLVLVTAFQAFQIHQLSERLAAAKRQLAEAQAGDGTRFEALEGRVEGLEQQADRAFNPEQIASAVLPSVFRVAAGEFTGTAFAVGKPTADGGTNLFTNWHVVQSVWESGERKVFLERTSQRFPATIVGVDKVNDVALLTTDAKFTGLVTASTPVKSGQQIIVVGAPLGLEDSVTTGVVSATRKLTDGSGTVIQFDAPINPGNSGGPVINGAKEVVGIATAKRRDAEGIGLAVPIKTACDEFKIC